MILTDLGKDSLGSSARVRAANAKVQAAISNVVLRSGLMQGGSYYGVAGLCFDDQVSSPLIN